MLVLVLIRSCSQSCAHAHAHARALTRTLMRTPMLPCPRPCSCRCWCAHAHALTSTLMLMPNRRDRDQSRSDAADQACRTRRSGPAVHSMKGTPAQPSRHLNISREAQTRRCARVMMSEGRSAGQYIRSTDTRTNSRRILLPCCCKERRYCKCKNHKMDQGRVVSHLAYGRGLIWPTPYVASL